MSNSMFYHEPVLLKEVLDLLVTNVSGCYCDCTLGGGGHLREIAHVTKESAVLVGIDRDCDAISWNKENGFETKSKVFFFQSVFSQFDSVLQQLGIQSVDGILLDLGVSSFQINTTERGFTYMKDSNLDMRMNRSDKMPASEYITQVNEVELATILKEYGEIKNASRMARAIKSYAFPITTSTDLKNCLAREYGNNLRPEILAKIFQALRIKINDELNELRCFLDKLNDRLAVGGRVAIIAYHSLEDRIVKEHFKYAELSCICSKEQLECKCHKIPSLKRINRRAIQASEAERKKNPRSRSARLRVAQKV